MKRAVLAMILTAAMGSAFAQEATTYPVAVEPATAQTPAVPVTPVKSKRAQKEDRMANGTMIAAVAIGAGVLAAVVSGGDSDDGPSSP